MIDISCAPHAGLILSWPKQPCTCSGSNSGMKQQRETRMAIEPQLHGTQEQPFRRSEQNRAATLY
jgi:hypothetical protein